MTVSIPTLPPDSIPADPAAVAGMPVATDSPPAGATPVPAEGFDQILAIETPAAQAGDTGATEPAPVTSEQAAAAAAALLWAPLPLLAETPPPAIGLPEAAAAPTTGPAIAAEGLAARDQSAARAMAVPTSANASSSRAVDPTEARPVANGFAPRRSELHATAREETADTTAIVTAETPVSAKPDHRGAPVRPAEEPAVPASRATETVPEALTPVQERPWPMAGAVQADRPVHPTKGLPVPDPALEPMTGGQGSEAEVAVAVTEPSRPVQTVISAVTAPSETPAAPAGVRHAYRFASPQENIAADPASENPVALPDIRMAAKTFVSATQQEVRGDDGIVGTAVAEKPAVMPTVAADSSPAVESSTAFTVQPVHAAAEARALVFDLPAQTAPAEQARNLVATVLVAVDAQERLSSTAGRSVNLNFNIGGEQLAVRVEFRDGAVHAHFRTESAELRSALAQEWRHAAAAPENVLRLAADPVFSSAPRAESSPALNPDGGSARQQHQQQTSPGTAPESLFRRAAAAASSTPATVTPEAPRPRHQPMALHLQAVA